MKIEWWMLDIDAFTWKGLHQSGPYVLKGRLSAAYIPIL